MQVSFTGIVREIKPWELDKDKRPLPPEKITHQITFLDRSTGGDVVIVFPPTHSFVVGEDVEVKTQVKPQIMNYRLSLRAVLNPVEAAPLPAGGSKSK